ncbi:MAG: hypothetical protein H5T86_14415, partial [Armatimonadetes bacterium]|nr:hypothetical protein [Armatimonadota bacterium]
WGTGPIGGPKEATLTIEEKAPLSGSRSLRLESQGPDASHAIQQNIVLPPGEYELSFKYRWQPTQEGAAGTVLPRFGVKGPDGHWATDKYVYFKDVSPTGDRVQTYRSRFEIPAGHSTGFFQFLFQGHFGRVLIDDVAVTTIKQAAGAAVLPELARQPADAAKRLSSAAAGDLLEIAAGQRQSYARLRALAQKAGEQAAKLTMPLDNFAICVGRAVQVLSGAYVASASSEIFPSAPMGLKTSLRARLVAQGARLTDVRVTSEDGVLLASAVELTPDGQSELTFDIPLAPPEENYGWADAMADISFTCNGRRMWLPVRLTARLRAPVEVEPRGAFTPALLSLRAVAHCLVPGGCRLLAEGTQDGTRIGFQPVALGHGGPQEIVLTPASSAEVLRLIPGRDLKIDYKTDPPLAAGSFSVPVVPAALCTSLTSALKLDGQADDWPPDVTDQPVGPLTRLGGGEDPSGTQVFAGKYGTDLFILFRTRQPADAPIRASERPHDSSVWEDDCVEVFLQPPGQSEYYHFVLNFAGSKYEARAAGSIDASWNCAWEGAVWHGEGWWTLEMRIPLHELTKREAVAGPWRCNFCRHIAATDIACSWAPVEKSFHEPALFGYLLLSR